MKIGIFTFFTLFFFNLVSMNEGRYTTTQCTIWPFSHYDFCPNAYTDSRCCAERIRTAQEAYAFCIKPTVACKTLFALSYNNRFPFASLKETCIFTFSGIEKYYPRSIPTELCCFFSNIVGVLGVFSLGCALGPCINRNGLNCCVKRERPSRNTRILMNYPQNNQEEENSL